MPTKHTTGKKLDVLQQRAARIVSLLKRTYPEAKVALEHRSPLELLIATILSAQCTDVRVNIVTKDLFKKYRSASDFANADIHELEQVIRSTGFYRMKAKNIMNCCKALTERYGGKVPDSMVELIQLAGVGRKTANVVLSNAFGKVEGVVVDTHVSRLSQRLGLTKQTTPEKIELDLMKIFPKKAWMYIDQLLIWHGRKICSARRPKCADCPVNDLCPSAKFYLLNTK